MEKKKRQAVRYEMFSYAGTSTTPFAQTTYNIVFEKPSEITFFNYGTTSLAAIINNNIVLSPFVDVLAGTATTDYKITLRTNVNEVDTTRYVIKVLTGTVVQALVKFYVDSEV
jgi:hypothetical protein